MQTTSKVTRFRNAKLKIYIIPSLKHMTIDVQSKHGIGNKRKNRYSHCKTKAYLSADVGKGNALPEVILVIGTDHGIFRF